jgi:hypothetical protein
MGHLRWLIASVSKRRSANSFLDMHAILSVNLSQLRHGIRLRSNCLRLSSA